MKLRTIIYSIIFIIGASLFFLSCNMIFKLVNYLK